MAALGWILFGIALAALVVLAARVRGGTGTSSASPPLPPALEPEPPAAAPPAAAPPADTTDRWRRRAFEIVPRVVVVADAVGRLVDANREAWTRFPFIEIGVPVVEAFGSHELADGIAAAVADGRSQEFSVRLVSDGRYTFYARIEPFRADGERFALLSLADATEEIAYQELRSQFVANVSHELRTPLTGLRGMLEALEDPDIDPELRMRFAGRARQESERLEALVTDIMFLSELEVTQGMPTGEVSDLSAAARAAAEMLEPQADERNVGVAVDAPAPAWSPLTDRMARTVATNLIENAIRYAGPGSHATVTVREEEGTVVLEVVDDGMGIPERHLPHVFERFYRADPSRSKELGGTGLGLSIVKHIAERFGGEVEARSREGFGTTMRVSLPVAAAPEEG